MQLIEVSDGELSLNSDVFIVSPEGIEQGFLIRWWNYAPVLNQPPILLADTTCN